MRAMASVLQKMKAIENVTYLAVSQGRMSDAGRGKRFGEEKGREQT